MTKVREIKRRIKSVDSTQQITKTMEMVAAAKIRKAQEGIESARPYAMKMMEVLSDVAQYVGEGEHPLLEIHPSIEKVLVLALTSDRGLCGPFNTNIIRATEEIIARESKAGKKVELILVGRKGVSYFTYIGHKPLNQYQGFSDSPTVESAREISKKLMSMYTALETDQVYLVFNHFKSVVEQSPVEYQLLPIQEESVSEEPERILKGEYLFEPGAAEVLYRLLPSYIEALIYRALLESAASEHGARRTAMKNATDNAAEMINELTISFNRARQAIITQEISEIVGGAEAL